MFSVGLAVERSQYSIWPLDVQQCYSWSWINWSLKRRFPRQCVECPFQTALISTMTARLCNRLLCEPHNWFLSYKICQWKKISANCCYLLFLLTTNTYNLFTFGCENFFLMYMSNFDVTVDIGCNFTIAFNRTWLTCLKYDSKASM